MTTIVRDAKYDYDDQGRIVKAARVMSDGATFITEYSYDVVVEKLSGMGVVKSKGGLAEGVVRRGDGSVYLRYRYDRDDAGLRRKLILAETGAEIANISVSPGARGIVHVAISGTADPAVWDPIVDK